MDFYFFGYFFIMDALIRHRTYNVFFQKLMFNKHCTVQNGLHKTLYFRTFIMHPDVYFLEIWPSWTSLLSTGLLLILMCFNQAPKSIIFLESILNKCHCAIYYFDETSILSIEYLSEILYQITIRQPIKVFVTNYLIKPSIHRGHYFLSIIIKASM